MRSVALISHLELPVGQPLGLAHKQDRELQNGNIMRALPGRTAAKQSLRQQTPAALT